MDSSVSMQNEVSEIKTFTKLICRFYQLKIACG